MRIAAVARGSVEGRVEQGAVDVVLQLVLGGLPALLFVSPFSDSGIIMREMPSVSAVAQTPMTQADAAEARPAQDEADQIASIRPEMGDVGQSAEEDASRATAAVDPRMPGTKRGSGHHRARQQRNV